MASCAKEATSAPHLPREDVESGLVLGRQQRPDRRVRLLFGTVVGGVQ